MNRHLSKIMGDGVGARARRSAIWSFIEFGGGQALRLASNLVLTRLLFPEAFGLLALVTVVMAGLTLFSDTGVRPLIIQSERGDDPDFLNTAWTVQVIRGLVLWLIVLVAAAPLGELYDEPQLAQILPVAGFALVIQGFTPTSVYAVNRHLAIGRLIRIRLSVQIISLFILTLLAWKLQSVWALVIGNVVGAFLTTSAYYAFLPGLRNRARLERGAVAQLFHFGRWIFLSTAAGFLINQGDRAILGLHVSLELLGIYNVGYFLGSIPIMLSFALQNTVMTPLYRIRPPSHSTANRKELFRSRRLIAVSMLTVAGILAFVGPPLVGFLYDPRYIAAGAMITLFCVSVVPMITLNTIEAALLGSGDSRAMFLVVGTTALFQTVALVIGVQAYGVLGALLSPGLAAVLSYPVRMVYARKYSVFDPIQDFGYTLFGFILPISACIFFRDRIADLALY